eukprot:IDg1116t1
MMEVISDSDGVGSTTTQELLLQCLRQMETIETDIPDTAIEIPVSDLLSKVRESLHLLSRPISSANVPFRQIRDAVFDITQRNSIFRVEDWITACQLYLSLLKLVPLSYDVAAFSAVVTLMTNGLKRPPSVDDQTYSNTKTQSSRTKKAGSTECFVKKSLKFWKLLLELVALDTFAQNFADIGQNTAN